MPENENVYNTNYSIFKLLAKTNKQNNNSNNNNNNKTLLLSLVVQCSHLIGHLSWSGKTVTRSLQASLSIVRGLTNSLKF